MSAGMFQQQLLGVKVGKQQVGFPRWVIVSLPWWNPCDVPQDTALHLWQTLQQ